MYKLKLNILNLTWVSRKFSIQPRSNARAHVQSITQHVEFGWILSKTQFSIKNQSRSAGAKSNSLFEFDFAGFD